MTTTEPTISNDQALDRLLSLDRVTALREFAEDNVLAALGSEQASTLDEQVGIALSMIEILCAHATEMADEVRTDALSDAVRALAEIVATISGLAQGCSTLTPSGLDSLNDNEDRLNAAIERLDGVVLHGTRRAADRHSAADRLAAFRTVADGGTNAVSQDPGSDTADLDAVAYVVGLICEHLADGGGAA